MAFIDDGKSPREGFVRMKITVDSAPGSERDLGTVTFYPFEGSEHTVCNHEDQMLTPVQQKLFKDIY
jgi:hypothetical protein